MSRFLSRLASVRLTLALLAALAVLGALGTAIPQGLTADEYQRRYPTAAGWLLGLGLDHFYRGWLYRSLLAVFSANLLACGAGRSAEGIRNVLARGKPSVAVPLGDREGRVAALRAQGFRIASAEPIAAVRRPWAFLGFPLVHLAPFAVLLGGLWGSLGGYVGTKSVYVGSAAAAVDDGATHGERALPFELFVESFRQLNYPVTLQLKVLLADGSEVEVVSREGEARSVPGAPHGIRVNTFDPASGDISYSVETPGGQWLGPFSRGREEGAPIRLRPLGFKDPEVRRAEALVALRGERGEVLARQVVAVNEPLVHRGVRIYLTAWGKDDKGSPFVGLQAVRDPAQPLVWVGATALSLGLLLLLFGEGAWVREEGGQLLARASGGRKALAKMLGDS